MIARHRSSLLLGSVLVLIAARAAVADAPSAEKPTPNSADEPLAARRFGIAVAVVAREQAVHSP